MGTMMALYHRDVLKGKPQEVDVSLYESIFRMMEIPVAHYHKNNKIRERTPCLSGTSSPGGTYETRDGKWLVLVCSTDRTWEYLTVAMNKPELRADPRFTGMRERLANDPALDDIVRAWIKGLDYAEVKAITDREGVPVSLVYSIEDIFNDPHYAARENIVEMPHKTLGSIKMPGIVPRFTETPGQVRWAGPELGEHNEEVYGDLLGYSKEKIDALKADGVI
jgi:formyl-CoA transferase